MSDLLLRREEPGEEQAVEDVVHGAFGAEGDRVAALVRDLRRTDAWLGLSFVADRDGVLVGSVAFTRALLDAPSRLVDVLVLSPLGVVPSAQGLGVGSALVRHGLDALVDRVEPLVFLEGSPAFYPRFGFRPAGALGFRKPSLRIPDAAFQVLTLPTYETWMSGTLVYPDPFWRHDCVGLREPGV